MPAYTPAQEKAKREQREAILQVSDPSHVPAAAASEWEHGDGEMEAWVEENFTSLFEPKEKEYHHPVAARATREIKEALEITEKLKEGDSDNWEAVYEAIKTLLTRRVGSLGGAWHWITRVIEEGEPLKSIEPYDTTSTSTAVQLYSCTALLVLQYRAVHTAAGGCWQLGTRLLICLI
eukprot:COSAG01_NODE_32724_length_576_cov_2.035639_1_plen_178_part_01